MSADDRLYTQKEVDEIVARVRKETRESVRDELAGLLERRLQPITRRLERIDKEGWPIVTEVGVLLPDLRDQAEPAIREARAMVLKQPAAFGAVMDAAGTLPELLPLVNAAPILASLLTIVEPLKKLAAVADPLVAEIEEGREKEIAWRWIGRQFNPFRKVGALIWGFVLAVAGSVLLIVTNHNH